MLLVTGGAGFIGSNVVAALNDAGRDVAVCDVLGHDGKWRNLAKRRLADFVPPAELMDWLKGRRLEGVIHLGAISETTATDGDLVIETNFRLSMRLLDWCTAPKPLHIVYPPNRHLSNKVRVFVDWLAELFAREELVLSRNADSLPGCLPEILPAVPTPMPPKARQLSSNSSA